MQEHTGICIVFIRFGAWDEPIRRTTIASASWSPAGGCATCPAEPIISLNRNGPLCPGPVDLPTLRTVSSLVHTGDTSAGARSCADPGVPDASSPRSSGCCATGGWAYKNARPIPDRFADRPFAWNLSGIGTETGRTAGGEGSSATGRSLRLAPGCGHGVRGAGDDHSWGLLFATTGPIRASSTAAATGRAAPTADRKRKSHRSSRDPAGGKARWGADRLDQASGSRPREGLQRGKAERQGWDTGAAQ